MYQWKIGRFKPLDICYCYQFWNGYFNQINIVQVQLVISTNYLLLLIEPIVNCTMRGSEVTNFF